MCHAAQLPTATVEQGHSLNGSALQFQDSGSQAVGPGTQQRDFGVSAWRTEEMCVSSRKARCDEIWSEAPSELLPSKIKGGGRQPQTSSPTHSHNQSHNEMLHNPARRLSADVMPGKKR